MKGIATNSEVIDAYFQAKSYKSAALNLFYTVYK